MAAGLLDFYATKACRTTRSVAPQNDGELCPHQRQGPNSTSPNFSIKSVKEFGPGTIASARNRPTYNLVKNAGGRWNADKGVWELRYGEVKQLGLTKRIVKDTVLLA